MQSHTEQPVYRDHNGQPLPTYGEAIMWAAVVCVPLIIVLLLISLFRRNIYVGVGF